MKNLRHIGFITSWMLNEGDTQIEELQPIQAIVNEVPTIQLSPAHSELLTRMRMAETIITGDKFVGLTKEQKLEFLDELKWLTALNAQLGA